MFCVRPSSVTRRSATISMWNSNCTPDVENTQHMLSQCLCSKQYSGTAKKAMLAQIQLRQLFYDIRDKPIPITKQEVDQQIRYVFPMTRPCKVLRCSHV